MKKILTLSIALLVGSLAFGQKTVTRTFDVTSFDAIDASYCYEIEVIKGRKCAVTIEAPDDIINKLIVGVHDSELELSVSGEWWRSVERTWKKDHNVKATVTMPDLVSVELHTAAQLTSNDSFSPKNFDLEMSGASSCSLNIMTHTADIEIGGASTLNLKGLATRSEIEVGGASSLHFQQDADYVSLKVSGASNATMTGTVTKAQVQVSGASSLHAFGYEAEEMDVNCSGASDADVLVTKHIGVHASGASDIRVKGNPSFTHTSSTDASSIKTL